MIKITITRTTVEKYTVTESLLVKETPTDKTKTSDYGNRTEFVTAKEWVPTEVEKTRTVSVTLLEQEIVHDGDFLLTSVIKAINRIE